MKNLAFGFIIAFFSFFSSFSPSFAEDIEKIELVPIISSEDSFPTGKKVIFDASKSKVFQGDTEPTYSWVFEEGVKPVIGKEVVHSFSQSGLFPVTLKISQLGEMHSVQKFVHVYDTRAIILTKESLLKDLSSVINQAQSSGVLIEPFFLQDGMSIAEQKSFVSLLRENNNRFEKADIIIFYSDSSDSIQLFTNFWNSLSNENKFSLDDTFLIHITKESSRTLDNLLRQSFHLLNNTPLYTARPYALEYILTAKEPSEILSQFEKNSVEFDRIDAENTIPMYLFFSQLTSYLIASGISHEIIFLLLAFPFITFFIALFRQFVGISTFGIFIPAILTLSFQLFGMGFILGVLFLVLVGSLFLNFLFKRFEILTIPRVAFSLGILTFPLFGILYLDLHYHWEINFTHAIFPMVVMSTVAEKFMAVHISESGKNAIWATLKTIFVSIIAFLFVEYDPFKTLLISIPEFVFIPMILTIMLGRFTGLRLTEYWRFRSLLQEGVEE